MNEKKLKLNYSWSPEMYESVEMNYTWKIYKGYNPNLNFYPDSINYSINLTPYDKFMESLSNGLKALKLELIEIGHPGRTVDDFADFASAEELNKLTEESINEYHPKNVLPFYLKQWQEWGEIFYMIKEGDVVHTNIMIGVGYTYDKHKENNQKIVNYVEYIFPPKFLNDKLEMSESISKIIESSYKTNKPTKKNKIKISMLNQNKEGFFLDEFDITNQTNLITEYDLFYGKGFKEFNNSLVQRFKDGYKGLILFHGEPGTGKTYYIKSLVHQLQYNTKDTIVIYTPIELIEHLSSASFLNLLKEHAKKNIILLIEDAEEILVNRKTNQYTSSISNILNSTSGILNDIFGISIIATFNSDLKTIDKALLRNERLLALKEFTLRSKDEALKIAEHLKIADKFEHSDEYENKTEFSIADVTSNLDSHDIITHNYDLIETKKIGFGV